MYSESLIAAYPILAGFTIYFGYKLLANYRRDSDYVMSVIFLRPEGKYLFYIIGSFLMAILAVETSRIMLFNGWIGVSSMGIPLIILYIILIYILYSLSNITSTNNREMAVGAAA